MKVKKRTGLISCIITMTFILSTYLSSISAKAQENSSTIGLHPAYMVDNLNYGYINDNGKFAIGQQYISAGEYSSDGYAIVQDTNRKYGVINKSGNYIISPIYNYISDFQNGFAVFSTDNSNNQGIIDKFGNVIVKPEYGLVNNFCDGIAISIKFDNQGNGISYAFDTTGKLIFECSGYLETFNNGLAILQDSKTKLYGYVDKSGKLVIKQQYDFAENFNDGKADVRIGSNYYEIDSMGKILRKRNVDELNVQYYRFDNGFYIKLEGSYFTLYDNKGKVVVNNVNMIDEINTQFFQVSKHINSSILIEYNQIPKAIFDKTGKRLTDYIYYSIKQLDNGIIAVCTQNKTYLLDANLNVIGSFQKLQGMWNLSLSGNLIKATYDNIIRYYTKQGKLIFQSDGVITLNNGVKISSHLYTRSYVSITYPQIEGMNDNHIKDLLNTQIKAKFITDYVKSIPSSNSAYWISSSFNQIGDVLHIQANGDEGYRYMTTGAPKMIQDDYYFDMKTGMEYKLDDLFKKDSDYKTFIQSKVFHIYGDYQQCSNGSTQVSYNEITGYDVMKDKIHLYYLVYSLSGQPPYYCDLTYAQLDKFIDKSGGFWQSILKLQK